MKKNIHPTWHTVTVTCTCGNTFQTGSTRDAIAVDICSACHPFFTNEMRFVDRQGRVDRFRQKMAAATAVKSKKSKKQDKKDTASFKDILKQQRTTLAE